MNAMDHARTHADDLRRSAEVYRQARAARALTPRRWRRGGPGDAPEASPATLSV